MLEMIKQFLKKYYLYFVIAILFLAGFLIIRNTYTLKTTSSIWDGSIATSFQNGAGTVDNPYIINDGSEFAFFLKSVYSENNTNYFNAYYKLNNNIDFNGLDLSFFNNNKSFSGIFDGQGYNLFNFSIFPLENNNEEYYSLFGNLDNAILKNLNIYNVNYNINESIHSLYFGLLGLSAYRSTIDNISVYDINFSNNCSDCAVYSSFGILNDLGDNNFNNINISGQSNDDRTRGLIDNYLNSTVSNVIYNIGNKDLIFDYNEYENDSLYKYSVSDNSIVFKNNYSLKTIKEMLENNSEFLWDYKNNNFKLLNKGVDDNLKSSPLKLMAKLGANSISAPDSGISGSIVNINDCEKDYYYYMGLNYSSSSDKKIPTMDNKEIYNDTNLIYVNINYFAKDLENHNTATISLDEEQNQLSYYKVFAVNDNGTPSVNTDDFIEFDLINNPFTNRPNNKGFNGWITNYEDAFISIDMDTYTRKVRIPVTYINDVPNKITINFYATWIEANVVNMNSSTTWSSVDSLLEEGKMAIAKGSIFKYEDVSSYYIKGSISLLASYPSGSFKPNATSASGRCLSVSCEYYIPYGISEYDEDVTYYKKNASSFSVYQPQVIDSIIVNKLATGSLSGGYFLQNTILNGNSLSNYYDENGNQLSGNCSSSGGCIVYDLIPYKDINGNVNVATDNKIYYYLVTRDTNIVVLKESNSNIWSNSETKPFTMTSIHNGVSYLNSANWNVGSSTINVYSDINLENLVIRTNTNKTTGTVTPGSGVGIVGNYHNIRIGRGIKQYNGKVNLNYIIGGNSSSSTGSSNNVTNYSIIIESGVYNAISCVSGTNLLNSFYVNYLATFGNDYDRVRNDNNSLDVVYGIAGSFGGRINGSKTTDENMKMKILSGSFGSNEHDYTTGIYVGGRGICTTNVLKQIFVLGGKIYNLIGEPAGDTAVRNYNNVSMYIMGGEINMVYGGAGETETEGNRIIQMTGGKINYSIFGGSNGRSGGVLALNNGRVNGDSYIYIGGNSIVGDANLVSNNTQHDDDKVEAGSVFGVGNGNNNYESIGTMNNSYIIIDKSAHILRNIYGGGNYGSVGYSSNNSKTKIKIIDGTISGSVYAGGNNNGAGNVNYSTDLSIDMLGGKVEGSIYGGSKTKGIVYGNSSINVYGGTVNNSIYGGGEGGFSSDSNYGTFVKGSINVNIGENGNGPDISGNVYGGSAYGSTNSYYNRDDENATVIATPGAVTIVNVNGGRIVGSVYGGAKGSDLYTPTIKGDITVNVNEGTIGSVYGGFDAKGTPEGTDVVYLNGGTVGSAFGGGNNVGQNETNIYLKGSSVSYLYGGSNNSGSVTNTNVYVENGIADNIFGGNNIGGSCDESHVIVTGGNVTTSVYGGGNKVSTKVTNVDIYNTPYIGNVFGSGNEAGSTTSKIRTHNDGGTINVGSIYGGANTSGDVTDANVIIDNGDISNVYGGNNAGGITSNPYVTINEGNINNVYGGGNLASVPISNVVINGGTITSVYGGGNQASVTTANTTLNAGNITNVYGGGNQAGCDISNITGSSTSSVIVSNLYGGSNQSGNITTSNIIINGGNYLNIYGGNNAGGVTSNPIITINDGIIGNIYGGGNLAPVPVTNITINSGTINSVFGGGKQATVNTSSYVYINGGTVTQNVYGGGDEGIIEKDSYVYINNANINGSAYAGGNGSTATVKGNTNIYVGGISEIGTSSCELLSTCSIFGGGNAAITGVESSDNSTANVQIKGGTIHGNVYGGANTSKVYGETKVYIGASADTNSTISKGDINITGTVFGGGEANASGSTTYDYNYISVTKKIDVNIDGENYNISILGSIFGSGNASSTSGTSQINISNYGSFLTPKKTTSIQRTNNLTIDNSSLALSGAADRTNEYSDVLFTLSLIDELNLKNNSTLYLETGANLLKKLNSITSDGSKASVIIDSENGTVTKNVDNRIYMYEGKNLNIATNPNITAYGQVNGMTFFGMFNYNSLGNVNVGIYNDYEYDKVLSYGEIFTKGSYVLGAHKTNHDITVDGFYSNFMEDGTNKNKINYIEPVPESAAYYMWVIGELVAEYDIDLVASKYSTLGAYEFSFTEFSQANTAFEVLGFDSSDLAPGINLVNKADIPKIARNETEADNNFALAMESTNSGWLTSGSTHFYSDINNTMSGTTTYVGENSAVVPTMLFYLYHSKNIATTGDMGTVRIILLAVTKINDLEKDTKRMVLNINLSRLFSTANDYEAALTSGKKYEMFSSTLTNITSKSSLSAYFSLYASGESIYKTGYHRSLISNVALPENTKITMIDLSKNEAKYYYHVINANDVVNASNMLNSIGEVYYDLSMFEIMGASGSGIHYSDSDMNREYYDNELKINYEEFIFIIDYDEANINSDMLNNQLLFEMHDASDETIFGVLGVQRTNMIYNVYNSGETLIDLSASLDTTTIYSGEDANLALSINYLQSSIDNNIIYDTKGYDYKLGTKITLINNNGEIVSGTSLLGLYYEIDGIKYYPNIDGTTRIKLSDRVGNVGNNIKIHTGTSNIATGTYTLRLESYASPDGIYYGINSSDTEDITITVINEIYGLDVSVPDKELIVDKVTGKTLNNSNSIHYTIEYNSGLANPNIRLQVSRRKYDNIYSYEYVPVDLSDYVTNILSLTDVENEYLIISNPNEEVNVTLLMKDNLLNGTYKLDFVLYDGNQRIGSVEKYLIIK